MKKNILYISAIVFSIGIYLYAFFLVVSFKPSYEYSMFYKQNLTKYFADEKSMTITPNNKMLFSYELNPTYLINSKIEDLNLQFIGANTKEEIIDNKLQYIYGNEFSIYWQWADEVSFDEINILIEVSAENDFDIIINGEKQSNQNSAGEFKIYKVKLKYDKQNNIKFSSDNIIKIKQISFEI